EETPYPVPRHISSPLAVCEEIVDFDTSKLPEEIVSNVLRNGYVIIDEPSLAKNIFGLELGEGVYIRIYVEE
ncbi:MAG: hypothetical protein QXZ39_03855, partial [Desulfurococcaceae archaeon]